jgi:O-antigen/teichoic acid export membrane protein
MTLGRTSILAFSATVVKILAGLVINKAVALYIGPSGLALIGQFQNFSQMVNKAAQGGVNAGVTKYAAEYGKDAGRLKVLFSTASKISLISSLIIGIGIVVFSKFAAFYVLKSESYEYIFIIFGVTIVFFVANSLLLSIVNGLKEIKIWTVITIVQSLYSLIFTTTLITWLELDGALIALVTNQSVILIVTLWMLRKHSFMKLHNFTNKFCKVEAKKLFGYASMTMVSFAVIPISQLIIRNYIGDTLSWDDAGYWQAVWYVSKIYLMIVTSTLGIYYLPRLSEITIKSDLRKELLQGYKVIIPIVVTVSTLIFFSRDLIIGLLFTQDFSPIRELFLWQLVGDTIKIASWLIAYIMVAKAMTKVYIVTEIMFSVVFTSLSIILIKEYGLIGVTYAFSLSYFCYFIAIGVATRKKWF